MICVDTGPLVALFSPNDPDHAGCKAVLKAHRDQALYTTEAALTEVMYMLMHGSQRKSLDAFIEFVVQDQISIVPFDEKLRRRAFEYLAKYSDMKADYADASLLSLAESFKITKVFTLDFIDFRTYRIKSGLRYRSLDLLGSELLE